MTVMQNLFFGVNIDTRSINDDDFVEEIIEHDLSNDYYSKYSSMGSNGTFIGIEYETLQDDRTFDLSRFIANFNQEKETEKFKEKVERFLQDPMWNDYEEKELLQNMILSKTPTLLIIPETD